MAPPSVALLRSKTQLVVFAGPEPGAALLQADPVENSAIPDFNRRCAARSVKRTEARAGTGTGIDYCVIVTTSDKEELLS